MASEAPLKRDNTMVATAKEGIAILEKSDPKLAEECKAAQNNGATNGSGDAPATNGQAKMTRDNTMVTTAEEGKKFLEKEGGVNEDAKTRAQEKELKESPKKEDSKQDEEKDAEKEATKRPATEDKTEVEEVKKQKVEDEKATEQAEEKADETKA